METSLYTTKTYPASGLRFALRLYRDPLKTLSRLAREQGDIAHVHVGRREVYLLNHPDFVEQVLVTQSGNFTKGPALQRAKTLLGNGLLTSEGENHLLQRRVLQPAFHRQRMEAYAPLMIESITAQLEEWRDGQHLDMADEMKRLTLDIALKAFFGSAPAGTTGQVNAAVRTLMQLFPLTALSISDATRKRFPRFNRARDALNKVTGMLLSQPRPVSQAPALIHILKEHSGDYFTEDEVHSHALTFLLAGHETTALLLAWAWDLLAHSLAAQRELQTEAARVLGERLPIAADLEHLPYTRMVIKETLRLRPPVWVIGRQALDDCQIGGQTIRSGATVLVSQWVMHHDPRFYAAPEQFRPRRWEAMEESSFPRYAYFPFGGGTRACIGEHFAMVEATLALACIARYWGVRPVNANLTKPQPSITLRPHKGILLIAEKQI